MRVEERATPDYRSVNVISYLLLGISIALFITCLFLTAYTISGRSAPTGFEMLLIGWMGILYSMLEWYANPLLVISWALIAFRFRAISLLFSLGSLYLAMSFLSRTQMILNEAPDYGDIASRDAGYWVWIASISFSIAAAVIPLGKKVADLFVDRPKTV